MTDPAKDAERLADLRKMLGWWSSGDEMKAVEWAIATIARLSEANATLQRCLADALTAARREGAELRALDEAVREFLAAEDEVEKEARRADANDGQGWSSAPTVRRLHAVAALRALAARDAAIRAREEGAMSDDAFTCESCGSAIPVNAAIGMEDCWFCPACYAEFRAEFDACNHEWEPHTDSYGDPGQYCRRCSGFVGDDVFAAVFPDTERPR